MKNLVLTLVAALTHALLVWIFVAGHLSLAGKLQQSGIRLSRTQVLFGFYAAVLLAAVALGGVVVLLKSKYPEWGLPYCLLLLLILGFVSVAIEKPNSRLPWLLPTVFSMAATLVGYVLGRSAGRREPREEPEEVLLELAGAQEGISLDLGGGVVLKSALIPEGSFWMGSPLDEEGRSDDEGPQHEVEISKAFCIGKHQVTQRQWQAVMGSNPSKLRGELHPVEEVSWDEAASFCSALARETGRKVRLPTEAEWEYACRAESTTRFCFGDSESHLGEYAWHRGNSDMGTHPVGKKKPNDWGLYDMHGNVSEWCSSWYGPYDGSKTTDPQGPGSGEARVLRGGSWSSEPGDCRSASRHSAAPGLQRISVGLRVVVDVD
jgi:formylglycine-generating enzyme required for sulfatase activity